MINRFHFDLLGLFLKFFDLPYSVNYVRPLNRLFPLKEFYFSFSCFLIIQNDYCILNLSNLIFLIKDYRFYIFFELLSKFKSFIRLIDYI